MMLSALAGFVAAFQTGNVWLGFPAAAAVGTLVALIVAFGSIKLSLNQVAVGFVLFALCTELSRFLGNSYVGRLPVAVPVRRLVAAETVHGEEGRTLFGRAQVVGNVHDPGKLQAIG